MASLRTLKYSTKKIVGEGIHDGESENVADLFFLSVLDTRCTQLTSGAKKHCNRYSSLLLKSLELPDAIAFACEDIVASGLRKDGQYLESGPDQQEGDSGGDALMVDKSSSSSENEIAKSKLSRLMLEARDVSENG